MFAAAEDCIELDETDETAIHTLQLGENTIPDRFGEDVKALTEGMLNGRAECRPDINDIISQPFIKIHPLDHLKTRIDTFCNALDDLYDKLMKIGKYLKKLHRRICAARICAASFGLAGGVLAVGAGVAAICTGGALGPLVVGIAAGSTSAVASLSGLAAQLAKRFLDRKQVKQARVQLVDIRNKANALNELLLSLSAREPVEDDSRHQITVVCVVVNKLQREYKIQHKLSVRETANVMGRSAGAGVATAKFAANVAANAGKEAVRVTATSWRVVGPVGIVFGVAGVGIDIWQIVDAAIDLGKDNPSEASRRILNVAKDIKKLSTRLRLDIPQSDPSTEQCA